MFFNDLLLLQLFILINIHLFFNIQDLFTMITNSVIYLLLMAAYMYLLDGDIYVSFLLILDLGVFFIFFSFLISLTDLFVNKFYVNSSYNVLNYFLKYVVVEVPFLFLFYNPNFLNNLMEYSWVFFVTHTNYFSLLSGTFQSDMQLLRYVFFYNSYLEFVLLSVLIYFSIFIIASFYNFISIFRLYSYDYKNTILGKNNANNSVYFFKKQNFNKQVSSKSSTRSWFRKK